ncbi:MAG TPA: beta-galactosidase [Firmicutes bacterium]|jgi:beta-galactosidase|nr:beta-galactosidase [Bacillota bacterium]
MINSKMPVVYYGGDYNPDQWPEEIWQEDMRLFKAAGINIVTLPVFNWAKLQPAENVYNFEWLDKILDLVTQNGLHVCLATSTAAQPAWMSKKYPEMLPVNVEGKRKTHGGRVNFCPTNPEYREFSVKLARKMAERYQNHPALLVWHIGNEYGNYCYCEHCAAEFRNWLKARYGTIEELNRCWNMSFWGHTVYDWEEIVPPSHLNEMWLDSSGGYPRERTCFQGISLDYNRFMSDASMQCYLGECQAIKEVTPNIPITTNLMGAFKPLDYFKWGLKMDVVSWDNYPSAKDSPGMIAFRHDLMRGLKDGQPFMLMEQTPSQQNWQPYNSLKRPGVMRLWSYQALAHGADTIMFFQLRRSFGACEKYHGAVIEHVGHGETRVFRECAALGEELKKLEDILDSRIQAKAAIMFDWENWWAVEFSSGPSRDLKYVEQVEKYYSALHKRNIAVDIIPPDGDLSQYQLVIAPVLYMVKPGVAQNIEKFVAQGGTFVTTFLSGLVNENDLVTLGGYPGELRKVMGIWAEEIDALYPDVKNQIVMKEPLGDLNGVYECGMLCDLIHSEGAKVLAVYGKDFYAGMPVLTENKFGEGKTYYVASDPETAFIDVLITYLCDAKQLKAPLEAVQGVEITQRFKEKQTFMFVLNHRDDQVDIDLKKGRYRELISGREESGILSLPAKGVAIFQPIG